MNCSIKIIVYFHSVCVSAKLYLKFFPGAQPHDAAFFKNAKQASFGNIFISLSIFLITDCEKPPTFRMSYTSFTAKCLKSSFRWSSICLQVPSNSVFVSFCLHSKFIPFRSQLAFIIEIKCYICRALPRIFFFREMYPTSRRDCHVIILFWIDCHLLYFEVRQHKKKMMNIWK